MKPESAVAGHDAIFCEYPPAPISAGSSVRWIQIGSVGFERWLPFRLPEKGIALTNSAGVFDAPIAEWNVAMMVNLSRDMKRMIHNQEARIWDRAARFQMEVRGKTVGFWGYGGIGRETARLAKAMGLRVHALVRHPDLSRREDVFALPGTGDSEGKLPDRVFLPEERVEFLRSVDFLVLGIPLTAATQDMMGEEELRALHSGAFLLNPARAGLIREEALRRCLEEGWIAGAALDTHYAYPLPPSHWLWGAPNVMLTPHISGSHHSPHFLQRVWTIFAQNLDRRLAGRPFLNKIKESDLAPLPC